MKKDIKPTQITWTPPAKKFEELMGLVQGKVKAVKYVLWAGEGIRLTVKDNKTGKKSFVTIKNMVKPDDTLAEAKKVLNKLNKIK